MLKTIILASPFALHPHPVCNPWFVQEMHEAVMLASCHAVCEIIQMRTPCFFYLLPWVATWKQGWSIHDIHFSSSHYDCHLLLPPRLCESIGGTFQALWGAINECVACCDARHITAIHQHRGTLDRRTANRLCNHITQPCQACHDSVSHSGP